MGPRNKQRVFDAVTQRLGGDLVGFLSYAFARTGTETEKLQTGSTPYELHAQLVEAVKVHFPSHQIGQATRDKTLALRADAFMSDGQLNMLHRHFTHVIPALSAIKKREKERMPELVAMFKFCLFKL